MAGTLSTLPGSRPSGRAPGPVGWGAALLLAAFVLAASVLVPRIVSAGPSGRFSAGDPTPSATQGAPAPTPSASPLAGPTSSSPDRLPGPATSRPAPSAPTSALPSASPTAAPSGRPTTRSARPTTRPAPRFEPVKIAAWDPRNRLYGRAAAIECPTCATGRRVQYLGQESSLVVPLQDVAVAGRRQLTIVYESAEPRTLFVAVGDQEPVTLDLVGQGDWTTPARVTVEVFVPAGDVDLKFYNARLPTPDLDQIILR
ncbi:MAG: hypothetical protein HY830_05000 [Actinobacteria bacterium]|nr:hypothetical protein [Actinomycetota bacterium]